MTTLSKIVMGPFFGPVAQYLYHKMIDHGFENGFIPFLCRITYYVDNEKTFRNIEKVLTRFDFLIIMYKKE